MSIQGSSRITVEHSQFTNVGRDQHNNNNVRGDLIQYFNREERQEWYYNVPTCKVRLKRRVGETLVQRWDQRKWRHLNACRKISIASISGEDKDSEFLYILYTGPDAFKAFQQDFEQFSSIKDINCVQLYGYNQGTSLPALPLAPVPFSQIFEQNQLSPLLYTYICCQFGVAQIASNILDVCELWINPRTGQLSRGPFFGSFQILAYLASGFSSNSASNNPTPLPLQAYSDSTTIFNYLIQTLTAYNILQGINTSSRGTYEVIANKDTASVLLSLPGTIYHITHREIIARWPGDRKKWYYKPDHQWNIPDAMWESKVDMNNGSIRFTVLPSDIQDLQNQSFGLCYTLLGEWNELTESWLSQAHSVFSQLGICKDEWEEYTILSCFWLSFQCQKKHSAQKNRDISASEPLYLFIQPIPRPSDSETTWNSWVMRSKYFWSFDSSGCREMSEDLQVSLELLSFASQIEVWHIWWNCSAYDAIQQLHASKGFNPKTLSLTQSLKLPIFEVVGGEGRLEELQDAELPPDATCSSSLVIEAQVSTQSSSEFGEQSIILVTNRSYSVNDTEAPPTSNANINIGSSTVGSDASNKALESLKLLQRNKHWLA
ncbi:hypothetical protein WG66_009360 [Moniliophthora roreri]|nr:hypothetical protein WG66_009360 [Moniliophthora roreri]